MGDDVVAPQGGVTVGGGKGSSDRPPRLQLWPLTVRLLLSLVLPVSVALLLDRSLGTMPWLTLITSLLCIPLATVIVGSAVLRDFERVLAQVAPADAAEPNSPEAAVVDPDAAPDG